MKNVLVTIFFSAWITGLFFGYRHVIKKFAAAPQSRERSEIRKFYATIKDRDREIRQRADESIRRQQEFIESHRRSSSGVDPDEVQRRYRERMDALKSRLPDSRSRRR